MIDITKQYTCNGRPVTQLVKFKIKDIHCIWGVVEGTSEEGEMCSWAENGDYYSRNSRPTEYDLVEVSSEQWVNLYWRTPDKTSLNVGEIYNSKKESDKNRGEYLFLKTIRIDNND